MFMRVSTRVYRHEKRRNFDGDEKEEEIIRDSFGRNKKGLSFILLYCVKNNANNR